MPDIRPLHDPEPQWTGATVERTSDGPRPRDHYEEEREYHVDVDIHVTVAVCALDKDGALDYGEDRVASVANLIEYRGDIRVKDVEWVDGEERP